MKITPIPIPGLLYQIDVDGFLSNDLEYLYIDQSIYYDDRYENRLRFTYAHELGHLILHKVEIQQCKFCNENDWINFREDMQENDLTFFEQQAYEFAGRLLVPKDILTKEIFHLKDQIDQFRSSVGDNNDEMIKEAIRKLIRGQSLSEEMAEMAMAEILDGRATTAQMASFTTALRIKGESVDEITGCAKTMRSRMPKVHLDSRMVNIDRDEINIEDETIIDTCGTGGSETNTFNVSTATALVVAGGGIKA